MRFEVIPRELNIISVPPRVKCDFSTLGHGLHNKSLSSLHSVKLPRSVWSRAGDVVGVPAVAEPGFFPAAFHPLPLEAIHQEPLERLVLAGILAWESTHSFPCSLAEKGLVGGLLRHANHPATANAEAAVLPNPVPAIQSGSQPREVSRQDDVVIVKVQDELALTLLDALVTGFTEGGRSGVGIDNAHAGGVAHQMLPLVGVVDHHLLAGIILTEKALDGFFQHPRAGVGERCEGDFHSLAISGAATSVSQFTRSAG